jgi:hypothetical protein
MLNGALRIRQALLWIFQPASSTRLWPQGNRPTACWTISISGQAPAKARMYIRLAREKPFMSGKAVRRSCASRSITLAPQPCAALPLQDVAPDLPVQQHQLAVDRQRRALLRGVDAGLQLGQPVGIAAGWSGE